MTVFLGADHRGFALKEQVKQYLLGEGIRVVDKGAHQLQADDDFVDFAKSVADEVSQTPESRGILLCGSGIGMCIAANKIAGIRAAVGMTPEQVKAGCNDDAINVLALASDFLKQDEVNRLVETFLHTDCSLEERFQRRLMKIRDLEAL